MTWQNIVAPILLAAGVVIVMSSCLGVLVFRNSFARLHAVGPATLLGSLLIIAAIIVDEWFSQTGIKALLVGLALWAANPIMSHATAQALYRRQHTPESQEAIEQRQSPQSP